MSAMTSQITDISIVCSTVCSGADQGNHQSSVLLAIVGWIHRWPVNSPHKRQATRIMLPFDDVIMISFNTTVPIPPASQHMASVSFNSSAMAILETNGIYNASNVLYDTLVMHMICLVLMQVWSISQSNCCFNWAYVHDCVCVYQYYSHISHYFSTCHISVTTVLPLLNMASE